MYLCMYVDKYFQLLPNMNIPIYKLTLTEYYMHEELNIQNWRCKTIDKLCFQYETLCLKQLQET